MQSKQIWILFLLYEVCNIASTYAEQCPKFSCATLDNNQCFKKDPDTQTIYLQLCQDNPDHDIFCPFMTYNHGQAVPATTATCTSRKNIHNTPKFPGNECESDDECSSRSCKNNKCTGKQENEGCKHHAFCNPGLACKADGGARGSKACKPQGSSGEQCNEDFDCKNNYGCHKGVCTKYFSLELNSEVDVSNNKKNILPMCKSGMTYKGKCVFLANVETKSPQCDEKNPCKYKLNDSIEIQLPEFCECSKNVNGTKHCLLGNGESEWIEYLEIMKTVFNLDYSSCNTIERPICSEHKKTQANISDKYMEKYLRAVKYHEIIKSESCVIGTFYPQLLNTKSGKRKNFLK